MVRLVDLDSKQLVLARFDSPSDYGHLFDSSDASVVEQIVERSHARGLDAYLTSPFLRKIIYGNEPEYVSLLLTDSVSDKLAIPQLLQELRHCSGKNSSPFDLKDKLRTHAIYDYGPAPEFMLISERSRPVHLKLIARDRFENSRAR